MSRRAKGEGSLLLLKGCAIYYAQFYQNGKQVRQSTGKRVKQEALVELRRLMGRSDAGLIPITELRKITYAVLRAGLLANYEERGNNIEHRATGAETIGGLPALDSFFGFSSKNPGPPVTHITTDTGRAFTKRQLAAGYSPATINRSLACLRRMLRIAYEDGKLQNVPVIRLLTEPPARKGFLAPDKFTKLLKVLPTHLRPLTMFLYWCGVRLGEAQAIEWTQVDLSARLIRLDEEQTKNSEARNVPLPAALISILADSKPKAGRVFDDTNLRTEWAKACTAVGLGQTVKQKSKSGNVWFQYSGLIVHDLRRSAIRNLVNAGVPEKHAMAISGHKTRSVFDRYTIVSTADVTNAMNRLETSAAFLERSGTRISVKLGKKPATSIRKLLRARSSSG